MNAPPNPGVAPAVAMHPRQRKNFMLFLVITMLILIPLESLTGTDNGDSGNTIYQILNNVQPQINTPSLISITYNKILLFFDLKHLEGTWKHKINSDTNGILAYPGGKATISFVRQILNNTENISIFLDVYNGNYIDHGLVRLLLPLEFLTGLQTHVKGNYSFYMQHQLSQNYKYIKRLQTTYPSQQLIIQSLNVSYVQFDKSEQPTIFISIATNQFKIDIVNAIQTWHIFHHILLSFLLCIIISVQFLSTARMIRRITSGQQQAEKYSLITFFIMVMWDIAVTLIIVFLCFSNDQLFLIYLIPTFLSVILFTFIQLRIIQIIFDANYQNRGVNFKQMMRFFAWAGLIGTYPIIVYTNLSSIFFALLPLIIIPQLYRNAERGRKSFIDLDFLKLFLPRFVFILYIKGFSKNVFSIQPSITCCVGMLTILASVLGLLFLQTIYGSRIIFPKFMLPQAYNYFQDDSAYSVDIEVGVDNVEDCAICLTPVHLPPADESELRGQHVGKMMTTPCKHRYHGTCLVQWIQQKMQCPTCRSKLPAYD